MSNHVTRGYGLLEGFLARKRTKLANSMIPPEVFGGSILDIGCGSYPFFLLQSKFKTRVGIDQVGLWEEKLMKDGLKLIKEPILSGTTLPFGEDSFDVVTMLAVFEHIEPNALPGLINEIHRVLKRNGRLIMTTPAGWTDGLLKLMSRVGLVSHHEIDEHKDSYTHDKIEAIFRSTRFHREGIKMGTFELGMNLWVVAVKT